MKIKVVFLVSLASLLYLYEKNKAGHSSKLAATTAYIKPGTNGLMYNQKGNTMPSYPLIVVSLEGPDGSGKSTLSKAISEKFYAIYPPKSSSLELMPSLLKERIKWFREEDSLVTARTYLTSHQVRFKLLEEYNRRCHHKLIDRDRFDLPSLLIWDRGPLSTRAYAYASIKTNAPGLKDEVIKQFIDGHFHFEDNQDQIIYVLMYPDNSSSADQLLKRTKEVTNTDIELSLIRNQIIYKEKFWLSEGKHFLNINPLDPLEENIRKVFSFIEKKLKEEHAKNISFIKNTPPQRFLLSKIIQTIDALPLKGKVIVAGGIVEKGYSDNDIDLSIEEEEDRLVLEEAFKNYPIHFLTKMEFSNIDKNIIIEIPK